MVAKHGREMRKFVFAAFVVFFVEFVVAPVGGRVFDYFFPAERGFIEMIPDIPFYQLGYASVLALGFVLGVAFEKWLARRAAKSSPVTTSNPADSTSGDKNLLQFDTKKQRDLLDALKGYVEPGADEYHRSDLNIAIVNVKYKSLAEMISSIFELAGWQTRLNTVPYEQYREDYIEGIEVAGHNKHLVESIAELLSKNGVRAIRPSIKPLDLSKSNPKWDWAQRRIEIVIGHH